jgi:hypothetical protein
MCQSALQVNACIHSKGPQQYVSGQHDSCTESILPILLKHATLSVPASRMVGVHSPPAPFTPFRLHHNKRTSTL